MNWDHLCKTCLGEFETCSPESITFGIDVDPLTAFSKDADRVLECSSYMPYLPILPDGVKR